MAEKRIIHLRWNAWPIWVAVAIGIIFLYLVRSVLPPFLVGAVLAYVLGPVVAGLEERWRMPRPLAITALYLAFLVPLILVFVFFGHRFFGETRGLFIRAPVLTERILTETFGPGPYELVGPPLTAHQIASDLFDSIRSSLGDPTTALHFASAVVTFFLGVFLSLIVSIYLLVDSDRVNRLLMRPVPEDRREDVARVSEEIHRTLALYLRRQMLLVAFVAAVTFVGLEFFFHLHYALPVAVFTGFVEIVPFFGPFAAGTVAALIALSQDGAPLMIGVIVFYVVLRQIEDQIVMPVVLGRAVELHPIVVIFAVLAGSALAGVIGTLVAVPVAASIKVILSAWPQFMSREAATAPPTAIVEVREPLPPPPGESLEAAPGRR